MGPLGPEKGLATILSQYKRHDSQVAKQLVNDASFRIEQHFAWNRLLLHCTIYCGRRSSMNWHHSSLHRLGSPNIYLPGAQALVERAYVPRANYAVWRCIKFALLPAKRTRVSRCSAPIWRRPVTLWSCIRLYATLMCTLVNSLYRQPQKKKHTMYLERKCRIQPCLLGDTFC